jgi:hypothetical protein
MVGHGQRGPRAIGIFSDHRNVVTFSHEPEASMFERRDDPVTVERPRESVPSEGNPGFGNEDF